MNPMLFKVNFYKISSPLGNRIYIGSTEQDINNRFSSHIYEYHKKGKCSSRYLFSMYGVENCNISLIESHWVSSKLEQRKIERLYYQMYRLDCVNKNRPYVSEQEKIEQHRDLSKKWYEENKQYKIYRSLANYHKKKSDCIDCERCGKRVCALTLKSHMNSLKCKNHEQEIISSLMVELNLNDGLNQNQKI
jgi:hypothetical protein